LTKRRDIGTTSVAARIQGQKSHRIPYPQYWVVGTNTINGGWGGGGGLIYKLMFHLNIKKCLFSQLLLLEVAGGQTQGGLQDDVCGDSEA